MPLTSGERIGLYEIIAPIGAGGMGEVYRARDTKLNRDVEIEMLPRQVADDPERLARVEREARALSSLTHPNIAQIFDVEAQAIVRELVAGATLADLTASGVPLPLEPALGIARQIAAALEAAHDSGIIHHALTPSTIKVRDDGTVKVLDFGLAEARESDVGAASAGAYLAPEQVRGEPVDRRTDTWAFGAVLFEMLTGRPAFPGDDPAESARAILGRDPDLAALPADTPPAVRQLVIKCLARDPEKRLRSVGDAVRELDEQLGTPVQNPAPATRTRPFDEPRPEPAEPPEAAQPPEPVASSAPLWRRALPVVTLLIGLVAGAAAAREFWPSGSLIPPGGRLQFTETPSGDVPLRAGGGDVPVALLPDGTAFIYQSGGPAAPALALRRLQEAGGVRVQGTENAGGPFISADGRSLGFIDMADRRVLKTVPLSGGAATTIATASGPVFGATWTDDGQIVFGVRDSGLWTVPASGGEPSRLTTPSGAMHLWPDAIPGTSLVVFVEVSGETAESGAIAVVDRGSGDVTSLGVIGAGPRFASPGQLLYAQEDGTLSVVRFDASARSVSGTPVRVLDGLRIADTGAAAFDVAGAGRLVVVPAGAPAGARELVWVDQDGREAPVNAPDRRYVSAWVAPDDARLTLDTRDEDPDVWTWDLAGETLRRRPFAARADRFGLWAQGGASLVVSDGANLLVRPAGGRGEPVPLTHDGSGQHVPTAVTPAGTQVIFQMPVPGQGDDLFIVPIDGSEPPTPFISTGFNERHAAVSPDGAWIAYESDASNEFRVYVRSFQNAAGAIRQVSTGPGTEPVWSRDGSELFYLSAAGEMMAVPVNTAGGFAAGPAEVLFDASVYVSDAPGRNYDVASDARFLMIKPIDGLLPTGRSLSILLNWQDASDRTP